MKTTKRRNLPKLIEVYRVIEEYIRTHFEAPPMGKLIELGCAASSSTITYYYDELVELKMAVRLESGKVRLLPLEGADESIRKLL